MNLITKWSPLFLAVLLCVGLYLGISWASNLTPEDIQLCKMWIRLAIDGYEDPMPKGLPADCL
jgi:hypothetical protein